MSALVQDDEGRANLFHAIRVGDVAHVSSLIEAGVDANLKDGNGRTALILAVEEGNIKCLTTIIHKIPEDDINQKNDIGDTALHAAVSHGHTDCMLKLIEFGVNIKERNITGETALCVAAIKGHLRCVTALLEAGAGFDLTDDNDKVSLSIAARNGHLDCVIELMHSAGRQIAYLRDNPRDIEHIYREFHQHLIDSDNKLHDAVKGCTALCLACSLAQYECLTALIDSGLDLNFTTSETITPLCFAAIHGDLKSLTMLIKAGADVHRYDDVLSPLGEGVGRGHIECVKTLIEAGVDINMEYTIGMEPILYVAVENRDVQCMNVLIGAGANVDDHTILGITSLFRAVEMGYDECVKILIKAGAKVNKRNYLTGRTVLELAVKRKRRECVKDLIWAGASLYACFRRDNNRRLLLFNDQFEKYRNTYDEIVMHRGESTPSILIAAFKGQHEEVANLVESGVDVNVKGEDATTPLIVASWEGHLQCVDILLGVNKVDIEAKDYCDRTALYAAACEGHDECVKRILIKQKSGNDDVQKALKRAVWNSHAKCVEILLEYLPDSWKTLDKLDRMLYTGGNLFLIPSCILTLLKAGLFYWQWYTRTNDIRCITRGLIINGLAPNISSREASHTPLQYAFMIGDGGLVRYLVANLYLIPWDLSHFQTHTRDTTLFEKFEHGREITSADLQSLYHQLVSAPWRLEVLSILRVFNMLKSYDCKQEEAVCRSNLTKLLPDTFLRRLKFHHPIRYLCVRQWDRIEGELLNLKITVRPGVESLMERKTKCRDCCDRCMVINENAQ